MSGHIKEEFSYNCKILNLTLENVAKTVFGSKIPYNLLLFLF